MNNSIHYSSEILEELSQVLEENCNFKVMIYFSEQISV